MDIKVALSSSLLLASVTFMPISGATETRPVLPSNSSTVFQKASEDPNVLFYLGEQSYNSGDDSSALRYFLKASSYNHPEAILNARTMISKRLGVENNSASVLEFLRNRVALDDADVSTFLFLADVYRGDHCVWSAQRTSECAKVSIPDDLELSYHFYSEAAKRGSVRASHALAMMESLGVGTTKNPALALSRFELAASKGSASAAYVAGMMLSDYYGITPSMERARKFFMMAAESGHTPSMIELASNLHRQGAMDNNVDLLNQSVAWYEKAIDSPYVSPSNKIRAQYELAMLLNGQPRIHGPKHLLDDVASSDFVSEFVVKAKLILADGMVKRSRAESFRAMSDAAQMLERLPVSVQQRNAVVWQKMAAIAAQGTEKAPSDPDQYGRLMTRYRQVMEAYPEPMPADSLFGVGLFDYIGLEQ